MLQRPGRYTHWPLNQSVVVHQRHCVLVLIKLIYALTKMKSDNDYLN
jgi:hypothetical protein